MPPPALTSNCDASDAFHDQFSEIIRHEARLRGDNSEDAMGPGRKHWVEKHLKEVAQAQAQRRPSQLPSQASTLNEHAQDFVSPVSAQKTAPVHSGQKTTPVHSGQKTTPVHSGQITPWYESFNLADQGVLYGSGLYQSPGSNTKSQNLALAQSPNRPYNSFGSNAESHNLAFAQSPNRSYNSSGPNIASQNRANGQSPYRPFDPAEVAAYRAAVQAQLSQSSIQRAEQQPSTLSGHYYSSYNPDPIYQTIQDDPRSQFPSAHLNANAYTRYPSTPPNLPATYPYQTPSVDSLSDITTNLSLHASTEPITRSAGMSSLIAPDHYISFEILAFKVTVGDYIQSVQYPGEVLSVYAIAIHDTQPPGKRTMHPNDDLRIQWKGTDGTIRAKVFNGRDNVYVLRDPVYVLREEEAVKEEAVKEEAVKEEAKKAPKKKKAGKKDTKKDSADEGKKDV